MHQRITEFDQDNKPDYLGFHLSEDFDAWYNNQQQNILFNAVQDISIATDEMFMVSPIKKVNTGDTINPLDFLLPDTADADNEDTLNLKPKRLERAFGLKPTDDLAMIRLIV